MIHTEAKFVVERVDREEANRATLLQLAVSSMLSKKAGEAFRKQIKKMTES